jgi:hypothetical protein
MIDRKNLSIVIPILTPEGTYTIYIPDLPRQRVESALPVLGHLYSEQRRLGYESAVMVQDYEYYARQACKVHSLRWAKNEKEAKEIEEKLYSDFGGFVLAAFTGASVITPKYETVQFPAVSNKLLEEDRTRAEGYFTFFYAVLRYASRTLDQSAVEDWTSSLPVSEYAKHLMTLSLKGETSPETLSA